LKTGNLTGFIDNLWMVAHDSGELAATVSAYQIAGLDGDTDEQYRLISRVVNGYNGANQIYVRPNSDSGSNFGYQYLYGSDTSTGVGRGTGSRFGELNYCAALGDICFFDMLIQAKSGQVRTSIDKTGRFTSGSATVGLVGITGGAWNNTVDNLTSLQITGSASGLGIGSRFILLKKVTNSTGMRTGTLDVRGTIKGAWQEVYRTTLAAAATAVTVSGLLGNTKDQILRVRVRWIGGYDGSYGAGIRMNADATASRHGHQALDGTSTTASTWRGTSTDFPIGNPTDLDGISHYETLIYAKAGFVRTGISEGVFGVTGTFVYGVQLLGHSYNESATELTSLLIYAGQANGLGIGTEIVVERLNL